MSDNGTELQTFIGCKMIKARPMSRGEYNDYRQWPIPDDEDAHDHGYLVQYNDDYESWSPADVFESAYLPIDNPTKITPAVVDDFVSVSEVRRCGNHTVLVANVENGMQLIESSACVDPDNYNEEIGTDIAMKKVKDQLWFGLGFVLAWAKNGLQGGVHT